MRTTNEVRIKLHMSSPSETEVRNLWMCLNYDQKPTIMHIIEHIKTHYFTTVFNESGQCDEYMVKLYLEDYWLPPCENSKLIRENDCIRVEVFTDRKRGVESWQTVDTFTKYTNTSELSNNRSIKKQPAIQDTAYFAAYNGTAADWQNEKISFDLSRSQDELLNKAQREQRETANLRKNKEEKISPATKETSTKTAPKVVKTDCYKKFAIGSYVHMLNESNNQQQQQQQQNGEQNRSTNDEDAESLSEEQVIDDYYETLKNQKILKTKNKKNKKSAKQQQQPATQPQTQPQTNKGKVSEPVNIDKIVSDINSTSKQKWKNSSNKQTASSGQHIFFSSSDSSSSESELQQQQQQQQESTTNGETKPTVRPNEEQKKKNKQESKKKYYEPTKEEQLNSVSYNRSYVVQNPKNLNDFKKMFNQAKLNAPTAEEFMEPLIEKDESEMLNSTTASSSCNTSSASSSSADSQSSQNELNGEKKEGKTKRKSRRRSASPKFDYDKLENLNGAPRVDDRVAFQILEISSNFTPEISAYKNGTVIAFDASTNEVTLKLNSKYNSVLRKPSKFSVVLDETEEEMESLRKQEELAEKDEKENENLLKVDWRNLMNLKLIPKDFYQPKFQQNQTQTTQQPQQQLVQV